MFSVDVSFVLVPAIHTISCLSSLMRMYIYIYKYIACIYSIYCTWKILYHNMSIIHPSIYPSIYLSIHHHPSTYVYIYPSTHLSVCQSFHNQLVYLKIYWSPMEHPTCKSSYSPILIHLSHVHPGNDPVYLRIFFHMRTVRDVWHAIQNTNLPTYLTTPTVTYLLNLKLTSMAHLLDLMCKPSNI